MPDATQDHTLPVNKPQAGRRLGSVISPVVDLLCVGLGSILLFIPFVLFGDTTLSDLDQEKLLYLTIFLNMPHFLASYRIVYGSREMISRHPFASMWVPGVLVVWCVFAMYAASFTAAPVLLLTAVSGGYLAWHYTGQVWGMIATFAYLGGASFSKWERLLIRGGLRVLLVWHLAWFFNFESDLREMSAMGGLDSWSRSGYIIMCQLSVVSVLSVLAGFALYWRRTKRFPPVNSVVAWIAVCFWYAAMAKDPNMIFWVQIAHAVQYLIFPFRVEMNHISKKKWIEPSRRWLHISVYAALLVLGGILFERGSFRVGVPLFDFVIGGRAGEVFPWLAIAFLNIHHYFTDGCIWKISSDTVRKDLFAHLNGKSR